MKLRRIILIFLVIFIDCEDRRITFANNIKANIEQVDNPKEAEELIYNFRNKLSILSYTLTLKELNEVQVKFDLSNLLMDQIKEASYVKISSIKKVGDKIENNEFKYEEIIGAAIKEDDDRISFALLKANLLANLKVRYDKYYKRECHTWIFFKKCNDVEYSKQKSLTPEEIILIQKAASYSAVQSILNGVEILKRDDYELYMSDTGSIFSPDHKSVAHITYFGDIAIGPVSELNAILPLEHGYRPFMNSKELYTDSTINYKQIASFNYPYIENDLNDGIIYNSGFFHKFNFLVNKTIPKFIRQYTSYMKDKSDNGPFVLEVKKNGNVILYEEKTKKIIWETKTENQGTGPYNLHLTNDRILILEDSNGKILYKSDEYRDMPTIYYADTINDVHITNGEVLQFREHGCMNPTALHIKTDDDEKYEISYTLTIQETGIRMVNGNRKYFPPLGSENSHHINGFYASLETGGDSYSICYTAYSMKSGWTQIACDEEEIVLKRDDYFSKLIIYVKDKEEPRPVVFNI